MFLSQGLELTEILLKLMTVLGGLGIFLYGINQMGDSLKAIAGDRLRIFIEKTTNTPLKGILVGILVTALIQSSSGTTALAVGLVRSGLMTFPQAIGVIMGANVGTTVTAFIVGLKIEKFALLFVGIGAIIIFFVKNEKIKEFGKILFGFGLLFYGLDLMGGALKTILAAYEEETTAVFTALSKYPILGLLIGTAITAVVQSSSATIAILQTIYTAGSMSLVGAIPILIGCNIGTTVTAVFACVGGGVQAKRTAMVHAMFNVVGALMFMCLLWPYSKLIEIIEDTLLKGLGENPSMSIAVAHMIFNLLTTIVLYFFINIMVKIASRIVKENKEEHQTILDELLDYSLIDRSPTLALAFAKKSIDYMCKCVVKFVNKAQVYSIEKKKGVLAEGKALEEKINLLDKRIHDYLIKITLHDINENDSQLLSKYLDAIKDFERIGDHCTNLLEFFEERYETNKVLSEDGKQDLEQIFGVLLEMVKVTSESFYAWDKESAKSVEKLENQVDKMELVFHQRHVHRIDSGACSYLNADHYVEILSNIERIGDHLTNISEYICNGKSEEVNSLE